MRILFGGEISSKSRSNLETIQIFLRLVDYYLLPLLEVLSYQASLLPSIDKIKDDYIGFKKNKP
jgi:hypothetical protein